MWYIASSHWMRVLEYHYAEQFTSTDVRFWHIKTVPELKGLQWEYITFHGIHTNCWLCPQLQQQYNTASVSHIIYNTLQNLSDPLTPFTCYWARMKLNHRVIPWRYQYVLVVQNFENCTPILIYHTQHSTPNVYFCIQKYYVYLKLFAVISKQINAGSCPMAAIWETWSPLFYHWSSAADGGPTAGKQTPDFGTIMV